MAASFRLLAAVTLLCTLFHRSLAGAVARRLLTAPTEPSLYSFRGGHDDVFSLQSRRPEHYDVLDHPNLKNCHLRYNARDAAATQQTYWHDAACNLTHWRSMLFQRTMRQYAHIAGTFESTMEVQERLPKDPEGQDRFGLFYPIVTCPGFKPTQFVGAKSGSGTGKWLCDVHDLNSEGCVVVSIGGFNDYRFEEAMLAETPCQVHTYDCTVDGYSVNPNRHFFHKVCVGNADQAAKDPNFMTLEQLAESSGISKIDLLKMDIEGYEWDVMAAWLEPSPLLPNQISFELHYSTSDKSWPVKTYNGGGDDGPLHWQGAKELSSAQISLLFGHLANLGYAIVSREGNVDCCAEFTVIKVAST